LGNLEIGEYEIEPVKNLAEYLLDHQTLLPETNNKVIKMA